MPQRPIILFPEPILRARAQEITDASAPEVLSAVTDLWDTLDAHIGVGIAAPQIGLPLRAIAVDATRAKRPVPNSGRLLLLNPVIIASEGTTEFREGCLSLPDLVARVQRSNRVTIQAIRPGDGKSVTVDAEGFEAVILQHEIDHLDGVLFIDRVRHARDVKRRSPS